MKKIITILAIISLALTGYCGPHHGGPRHNTPPPPRHHMHHNNHTGGFITGMIIGSMIRPLPPPPPPRPQVIAPPPVLPIPVVRVWVSGRYVDQVQPNGIIIRVWQPGHWEYR